MSTTKLDARFPSADDGAPEPERYELLSPSVYRGLLGRRALFRSLGGGVLVLGARPALRAQESGGGRRGGVGDAMPAELGAWLHIAEDGAVTVYSGKAEVGQDIRTTLSQAVAQELGTPLDRITLVLGDTARTPYDRGTFGSRTTPSMMPQLRRAAAAARAVVLDRAAAAWKVPVGTLRVDAGVVVHPPTKRSLPFGQLTRGERLTVAIPAGIDSRLAAPTDWTVLGRPLAKVDGRAVVTGARRYTSDLERPGMLAGKVLRPPVIGAAPGFVYDRLSRNVPGAQVVREGDFVGVVAPDVDVATRALAALKVRWNAPKEKGPTAATLAAHLKATAQPGREADTRGDVEAGLREAKHRLEVTYTAAYIAHAPLEPRAAVAEWTGDRLTVWTGTQRPFGVRRELADVFRLPEDQIRVIAADTGSGYGGKHTGEAAIEAARLARAAGKPVKLVWTREEEFTWAYFRPAGVVDIRAGLGADGALAAWDMTNVNAGGSGLRTPYEVPHQRHAFLSARSPLRQGSYRGLAATFNHFARESAMDELATAAKQDPLEYRLRHLRDPRLRAVLTAAAERFGWGKPVAGKLGRGLACGTEKGGYVATCAEVSVDGGAIRVTRAVTAFECGAIVNPDVLRNQVEGAVIMGLGGALFEAIDFADGRVRNARFSGYRVPRFGDVPRMQAVLLDRKDLPSAGAGETPIVAIAPAIGNAVFAATGRRHRGLPMRNG